jgi:hypothetical protein
LPGSSARVKAFASLACRKGDGRFRSEADFSAFLPYVGFGSNSEVGGCLVDGLLSHCERTSPDPRFRSAKGQSQTLRLALDHPVCTSEPAYSGNPAFLNPSSYRARSSVRR